MAGIYAGDALVTGVYVGDAPVAEVYVGDEKVWPVFTRARMNKSGAFNTTSTTMVPVTGWVADPAYPGTQIAADRLKLTSGGTGKTVTAVCVWSNSTGVAGYQTQMALYRNGVQVGATQSGTDISGTYTVTLTNQTVAAGDEFEMRVAFSGGYGVWTMTVQPAGSFIRVE